MGHLSLRVPLLVLAVFVGVTSLFGAISVVPGLPPEWLADGPFPDYTIPAIALGSVGCVALAAAIALVARPEVAGVVSIAAGAAMVAFEVVEIAVVGFAIAEHGADEPVAWLQVVYLVIGAFQIGLGYALWRATGDDRERRLRTGHHLIGTHS
jgi:hypothetical protein